MTNPTATTISTISPTTSGVLLPSNGVHLLSPKATLSPPLRRVVRLDAPHVRLRRTGPMELDVPIGMDGVETAAVATVDQRPAQRVGRGVIGVRLFPDLVTRGIGDPDRPGRIFDFRESD